MNAAAPKNQNCELLVALPARKRGIKTLHSIESKLLMIKKRFMTEKVFLSAIKRIQNRCFPLCPL